MSREIVDLPPYSEIWKDTPKREPLSFGEIEDGRDNNKSYGYTCGFEDGVRWAEQQHDIGGGNEQS